jgi:FtsP/CotA-like multicopper oxidase with cupredoxin domain
MSPLSRRGLFGAAGLLLPSLASPRAEEGLRLTAAPARQSLLGPDRPETAVWAYNATSPGPVLRARQGETLRVRLENRLPQPTSIHWHGLRLPNAMDGVAGLTQPPVPPGGGFDYAFPLPDAGTHWYHPHWESHEQVARGLSGVLIVEEAAPPAVDRDLLWALGDWRLDAEGAIAEDFGNLRDAMHAGRIGNLVTINGAPRRELVVRAGERLRLRLVNLANARVFSLRFTGLAPLAVALDGQPVEPHRPIEDLVVLGPGMRADLILDCTGSPGDREQVIDEAYARLTYRLLDIRYAPERLRAPPPRDPVRLPPNPVPEPDLAAAERIPVVLNGGMMGMMRGGGMREARERGLAWTMNGRAAPADHAQHGPPLAELRLGRSYLLEFRNETAWPHPMHLHGHAFRVLTRNGRPVPHRPFRDTALLGAQERMEVAFLADNPGDWVLHCHVLEHQHSGMSALLRVA